MRLQRTWQIWSFAFAFALRYFALKMRITYGRKGMTPARVVERRQKLAAWLREGLVRLGPTFIKIGQQFSTRVDVLSKEFVAELEKLQVQYFPHSCCWCLARRQHAFANPMARRIISQWPGDLRACSAVSVGKAELVLEATALHACTGITFPG